MPTERPTTLAALRTILFDEIDKLREGKTTPQNVNAISNSTGKILSSIRVEMDYCKMVNRTPAIAAILPAAQDQKDDVSRGDTHALRAVGLA